MSFPLVLNQVFVEHRRGACALLLLLALVATAFVYWPSTHGAYVFDDYANIVENPQVHLHSLTWESLRAAAFSSPSPVLMRPLAMLSLGIDWYLSGGNPFHLRVVNLAIHLLNGILVFLLLRRITRFALSRNGRPSSSETHADLLAICIGAAWLLSPINFTAVAYIVQRMESLCQVFVLLGLYGYVRARERMIAGRGGLAAAIAAIALGTGFGALAKESAVLLPLYALIVEWALFGFARQDRGTDKRLYAVFAVVLVIPAGIAAAWAIRRYVPASAWAIRPFTLWERLLTEPRILFDYIHWSLLPTANALALYHDQIPLSRSLLDPPTTLLGITGLIALAGAIPLLKRTRPLAAIGIAWFLGAHLLTATIIPLELVFEHRNYFASIGLYLALFSLLLPGAGVPMPTARAVICACFLILFSTITWLRALDWSNPVTFALSEAGKNPDSPRTAYELGRTYVVLSRYKADSPLLPEAYAALEHAASMPGADALPDQGLLVLAGRLHQPTAPAVWQRIERKLAEQPLSVQNVGALYSLSQCAIAGDCRFPPVPMVQTFLAALKHPGPDIRVLSIYADYAINVLHDAPLAISLAEDAQRLDPRSLQARRNLLLLLQTAGRHADAMALYEQTLRELPEAGRNTAFVNWSKNLLDNAPSDTAAPVSNSMP